METWLIDIIAQTPLAAVLAFFAWHERQERLALQREYNAYLREENQRLLDETLPVKPE